LASALVAAFERTGVAIPVVYTNSTHAEGDSVYGVSKQRAAELLGEYQASVNAPFLDLVLPHLFGEFGRPNYNSAVTTFAHELATGGKPDVNRDGQLELLHAQDVAQRCLDFFESPSTGTERMQGTPITVGEAWDLLSSQHERYANEFTVPKFDNRFELQMFNTLRSQLYNNGFYPRSLVLHSDNRGAFVELARADGLGQTSLSTSAPGISRGDHFHVDKIERFVVVGGTATISLRRVLTDETESYEVNGDEPVFIDMPPLVTHKIENASDGVVTTLFWAGDHFDPQSPDTWPDPVESA